MSSAPHVVCQGQTIWCQPFRPCSCPDPIVTDIYGKQVFSSRAKQEQEDLTNQTLADISAQVAAAEATAQAAQQQVTAATTAAHFGQQVVWLVGDSVTKAFPPKTATNLSLPKPTTDLWKPATSLDFAATSLVPTPTDDNPAPTNLSVPVLDLRPTPLPAPAPAPAPGGFAAVPDWVWVVGGVSVLALVAAVY